MENIAKSATIPALASHPMIRELLDLIVPLIAKEGRSERESVADSYNLEIFDTASDLIQSFELLERSQNFVTLIPSGRYLQAQNINPYDWIEYHVSLFLITFVSIRDEVLLLVNSLFCLGIDPRHCNIFIIKSNKWIKDTTIPKHIESIELVIDSHRKRRNQLVHGGKTPSLNAWFKSANLDQLKAFSLAMQHKPEKISEDLKNKIEAAYVVAITQINRGLESEICQLKAAVWQLLNDAHKVYTERRAIFSTVNGEDPIDPK